MKRCSAKVDGEGNLCRFVGYERLQFTCDAWPVNVLGWLSRVKLSLGVKDARKISFLFLYQALSALSPLGSNARIAGE